MDCAVTPITEIVCTSRSPGCTSGASIDAQRKNANRKIAPIAKLRQPKDSTIGRNPFLGRRLSQREGWAISTRYDVGPTEDQGYGAVGRVDGGEPRRYYTDGMVKRHEQKQSFDAVDDTGNRQTLHVFVDIIDAGHFGDPDAEIEGMRAIRTNDGKSVNWLGAKKYQVVSTGQILTSNDPDAP
ncbi:MAG: hypothetical protein ABSB42_09750 [Tepidisphaeraceae bacterium]